MFGLNSGIRDNAFDYDADPFIRTKSGCRHFSGAIFVAVTAVPLGLVIGRVSGGDKPNALKLAWTC